MSKVLESAEWIASQSRDITISDDGVARASAFILQKMNEQGYSFKKWKEHALAPKEMNGDTLDWIFLVDLLNFSFFSEEPPGKEYAVTFHGVRYTGYWSLCACINRALEEQIPVTSSCFFATATMSELAHIFRADETSNEQIPLFEERCRVLHEAGKVLNQKFAGSFANCISAAGTNAAKLLSLLVDNFESFRDVHSYEGKIVHILKRAQILIADTWACFEGETFGKFADIDMITMFADYRVPQALVAVGAMEYSARLLERIKSPLASGDPLEVEIRGLWKEFAAQFQKKGQRTR